MIVVKFAQLAQLVTRRLVVRADEEDLM